MLEHSGGQAPGPNGLELVQLLQRIGEGADPWRERLWQTSLGSAAWHGVLFTIDGHRLLTALAGIIEVVHFPEFLAAVPGAPRWVLGVANHRGALLPLFDLRRLLLGTSAVEPSSGRLLVLRDGNGEFGLLVDEIIGIRRLSGHQVVREPLPDTPFADLVDTLYRDGDSVLPALDLSALSTLSSFQEPMSSSDRLVAEADPSEPHETTRSH